MNPPACASASASAPAFPMELNPSCNTRIDLAPPGADANPSQSAATPASPTALCARSKRRSVAHRTAARPREAHALNPTWLSRRFTRVMGTKGPSASPSAAPPTSPTWFDPRSSQRSSHVGLCEPPAPRVFAGDDAGSSGDPPSTPLPVDGAYAPRPRSSSRSRRSRAASCASTAFAAAAIASANATAPASFTSAFRMAKRRIGHPPPRSAHARETPASAASDNCKPQEMSSDRGWTPVSVSIDRRAASAAAAAMDAAATASAE